MTDLRTLAQAVVDTQACAGKPGWNEDSARAASAALAESLGRFTWDQAPAILAALNAERAQGYARAMGEVEAWATTEQCSGECVATWAREQAAVAEKEREG